MSEDKRPPSVVPSLDSDHTPSDPSKCICCGTPKDWETSRDLRIRGDYFVTDVDALRQATEDNCPDCSLILDAVSTILSIRPELELPSVNVSADWDDKTLFIEFLQLEPVRRHSGVEFEVMRSSGTCISGASVRVCQNNVQYRETFCPGPFG
jgi:hypothetical protein